MMDPVIELEFSDDHDLFGSCTTSKDGFSSPTLQPATAAAAASTELHIYDFSKTTTTTTTTKKLNHNAYERDRRKKMNELYSSLRSLLPPTDQTEKMSIPCTVTRVIKYIPEIRRHVETLTKRKEIILNRTSRQEHGRGRHRFPVVSVAYTSDSEVLVHIFTEKNRLILSKILRVFDDEGFRLLNASTLISTIYGDKTIYSLHLQMKESLRMDCKLCYEYILQLVKKHAEPDS